MVESNTVSQDTISAFTNVLKQNTTLTSLSLGASSTNHQGTLIITDHFFLLFFSICLVYLVDKFTRIGNYALEKMKLFAEALAQNKTLKSLR